ncbi:DUF6691 family protein [Shewanella sp. Isolate11]|uniref:DUF6691 family protein n=1 Tax=Shewanella sp. Isolate11 TaxID=2908530 RepID=UPI001EFD9F98|nr:DUF6691 family protein [Shewanella sp. Isolate11]MCG9695704.1 YeeE/YedE family protein [Shewanella sp. Isolate11]
MSKFIALLCGVLFGTGLLMSGLADPAKVLSFLNLSLLQTGEWDPSLILVMLGAIGIYLPFYWFIVKPRAKANLAPAFASHYHLPTKKLIDAPLLLGAALFGLGWGLVGICPGPAIVNLSHGDWQIGIFVLAMLVGSFIAHKLHASRLLLKTSVAEDL